MAAQNENDGGFLDGLCSQSFQVRQSAKSRLPAPLKSRTKGKEANKAKQRSCLFLLFTLMSWIHPFKCSKPVIPPPGSLPPQLLPPHNPNSS